MSGVQYYGGHCTTYTTPKSGCDQIQEVYNYLAPGAMSSKKLILSRSGSLTATWAYDTEGRMTGVTYPSWGTPGSHYTFAYDNMGRLNTLTDTLNTQNIVTGVTYGVANEVQQVSANTSFANNETHTYNSLFQLTQLTVGSALNMQYVYPSAGANNGKLTSQTDVISGEQITYTYDALNRLATAVTSDNPNVTQWGQSYNYDGFGNLTDQNLIKGTAPSMHVVYNASTNRQTGDSADYNGNLSSGYVYDIDNRLVQPGGGSTARYGYDANNKRVWRGDTSSGLDEIAFWAGNQKLCTYSAAGGSFTLLTTNVYFGAKLVSQGTKNVSSGQDRVQLAPVAQDRLGSMNGKFYPYGQERPSATTSDKEKFTGYFRDASTGLDYADQRYEQPGVGRFMTPDPYGGSAKVQNPGSWNRYAYTMGDPVNNADPSGLDLEFEPDLPSIGYFSFGFPWLGGGGGGGNWPKHSVELADVCDIQPRQCRLNAQGTAGRLIHVTNLSTTSSQALEVQNDLRWLREAIQADDTCNSWLSSGGTSASAGIDFMLGVGPGAAGMRVGVANLNDPTTGAIAGTGNTDMPLGSMSITVNTMGAFFNSTVPGSNNSTIQLLPPPGTNITPNTAVYQAFALLHELAHQLGANDFLDNDTSVARQTSNNQAVLEHCGSILSGLQ